MDSRVPPMANLLYHLGATLHLSDGRGAARQSPRRVRSLLTGTTVAPVGSKGLSMTPRWKRFQRPIRGPPEATRSDRARPRDALRGVRENPAGERSERGAAPDREQWVLESKEFFARREASLKRHAARLGPLVRSTPPISRRKRRDSMSNPSAGGSRARRLRGRDGVHHCGSHALPAPPSRGGCTRAPSSPRGDPRVRRFQRPRCSVPRVMRFILRQSWRKRRGIAPLDQVAAESVARDAARSPYVTRYLSQVYRRQLGRVNGHVIDQALRRCIRMPSRSAISTLITR